MVYSLATFKMCFYRFSLHRLDYCELLSFINKGTDTRRTFDRALQALPITQHQELWGLYIDWVTKFDVEETAIRVYRRYLMYDPTARETFVNYLEEIEQFEEAARQLSICLNDEHYM
jgi:pre-mRNA-splicing factor SYF1